MSSRLAPLRPRPWLSRVLRAPGNFWRVYHAALAIGLPADAARRYAWGQTRLLMRRRL